MGLFEYKKVNSLIVGLDDSNHAGASKGEIDVAVFSIKEEDGIIRKFPNKRNFQELDSWLNCSKRDYKFSILISEIWKHSSQNLVFVAPELVKSYIEEACLLPKELKLYFDGG